MKWQQVHLIRLQGSPGMHWENSFTVYFKQSYTVEINSYTVEIKQSYTVAINQLQKAS